MFCYWLFLMVLLLNVPDPENQLPWLHKGILSWGPDGINQLYPERRDRFVQSAAWTSTAHMSRSKSGLLQAIFSLRCSRHPLRCLVSWLVRCSGLQDSEIFSNFQLKQLFYSFDNPFAHLNRFKNMPEFRACHGSMQDQLRELQAVDAIQRELE